MSMNIKKYDIILVDLGSDLGSEQGGRRPCVVIQNNIGNLYGCTTLVMPLSGSLKKLQQPTHTLLKKSNSNGLKKNSVVLGECLRQISEQRIIKYIGRITDLEEKREIKRVYDANFGEDEIA